MTEQHPVVEPYLKRLADNLDALAPADRQEVAGDIRSHLAEAVAAGAPLGEAIEKLGSAEELARLFGRTPRQPTTHVELRIALGRFFKVVGLVAIMSIPTLVIVSVLGSVGLSFAASGVAVFFAGILDAVGDLPSWIRMDVPPVFAVAGGPVMSAVGVLCLIGLWFYITFLARAIRSVLPKD